MATPTGDVVLTGNALNLQAGYLFKNNYEIAGRYTTVDYESITGKITNKSIHFRCFKFIVGHKLKVQSRFKLYNFRW